MAGKVVSKAKKAVPEKKAAPAKKVVAAKIATAEKKVVPAKKTTATRKLNKGDNLVCGVCGLSVIVDEWGDIIDAQEIICCGKPMKQKAGKAKISKN
jgi:hypothetical protein